MNDIAVYLNRGFVYPGNQAIVIIGLRKTLLVEQSFNQWTENCLILSYNIKCDLL